MRGVFSAIATLGACASFALGACSLDAADKTNVRRADVADVTAGLRSTSRGEALYCSTFDDTLSWQEPYHEWELRGADCSDAFVDLASRVGDDTFVAVYEVGADGSYSLIGYNDDCTSGTLNSCLRFETRAGSDYVVLASTYEFVRLRRRTNAAYHLTVSCRDENGACYEPGQICGTRGAESCPADAYCDFDAEACGAADVPGVCRPRPEACTDIFVPVCGCDGVSYGNPCEAAGAGVDVASYGECERPTQGEGELCGGIAALRCDEGLVCDLSAHRACTADATGICAAPREVVCPAIHNPVCGCDGLTYENDCTRRGALVALAYRGACENPRQAEGSTCGGIAALECEPGLVCDYTESACAVADGAGVCRQEVALLCTDEELPTCGCDGVTYLNDCFRRQANVGLAHDGPC